MVLGVFVESKRRKPVLEGGKEKKCCLGGKVGTQTAEGKAVGWLELVRDGRVRPGGMVEKHGMVGQTHNKL